MEKTMKVLMADDEPDILEVMAKKVAMQGYDVVQAVDGQEAWDKIQTENPDVIVLDINMPYMDGFQVLKNVREASNEKKKWQPVIIVSARTELEDMKKSYDMEADHYISKPCNIEDILKSIKLMIQLIPQHKSKNELD